ncbi:MAG TPA: diaminopimelate decarboxylase, partial [Actinopolymorphaceae bacterium]
MSRAHEAGALHADVGHRGPAWLTPPDDVNALVPRLWPRTTTKDAQGVLSVGGVDATDLAERFGTPAYVVDE